LSHTPRVLLVEDNAVSLKVATLMLERQHIQVDTAMDGEAAVKAVQETPYRMVLMDVHLPGMNGLEAAQGIRKWEKDLAASPSAEDRPPVIIIALTAEEGEEMRQACLKAGMDDVLVKPLRPEKIQDTLERYLDQREPGEARSGFVEDLLKGLPIMPVAEREEIPVRRVMTFSLASETYALDLAYLKKIRWAREITPVPGLPPHILGITNMRGDIISVVDLKALLGIQGETPERPAIMVAGMKGVDVGLLVDSVDDLVDLPLKSIDSPMITFEKEYADVIDGEARLDDRLVVILNFERMMISEKMDIHRR
jgi:purine-binding chemotaxis protein CheW